MLTAVALALPFEFLLFQIACTYVGLRLYATYLALDPLGPCRG